MKRLVAAGLVALGLAAQALAASPEVQQWLEPRSVASDIAHELSQRCPLASPGSHDAVQACRSSLYRSELVRSTLKDIVLWGRQRDPALRLKDAMLTQFAPDVLTGMYLPLFMFSGEHRVEWVDGEGLFQLRLRAAFRNRLQPGEFPYPFWHDAEKWSMYQGTKELLLWWDPKLKRVTAVQFTVHSTWASLLPAEQAPPPAAFQGQWLWTDSQGRTQPAVTVFDGQFRADNPYLPALDASYKQLALRLREGQCDQCHVPSNPDHMKRLVLLQTPAHAAAEIQRLLKSVREDRMPRDELGIAQPLDDAIKRALLSDGEAFAKLVDAAKRWERATDGPVGP